MAALLLIGTLTACAGGENDGGMPLNTNPYQSSSGTGGNTPSQSLPQQSASESGGTAPAERKPIDAEITWAEDFEDGYAFVEFKQNGKTYDAFIDTKGVIQYRYESGYGCSYLGNNIYAIKYLNGNDTEYAIIDVHGNKLASSENNDFDSIITARNGLAICYKEAPSGVEYKGYYAVFDISGNMVTSWTEGPTNLSSGSYLGDGLFKLSTRYGNYHSYSSLFDSQTGKFVFITNNSDTSYDIDNGSVYAFLSKWTDYYNGDMSNYKDNDAWQEIGYYEGGYYQINRDGTIEFKFSSLEDEVRKHFPDLDYWSSIDRYHLSFYSFQLNNGKYILTNGDFEEVYSSIAKISIYDYTGKYLLLKLQYDGNYFYVILDENYQEIFDPIPSGAYGLLESTFAYCDKSNKWHFIDLSTGNEILTLESDDSTYINYRYNAFSNGLACVRKETIFSGRGHYSYYYINEQGETVIDTLYE